jgi:hypothetical protein
MISRVAAKSQQGKKWFLELLQDFWLKIVEAWSVCGPYRLQNRTDFLKKEKSTQ